MSNSGIFKAKRVANAALTGWLTDHAVVVKDGKISAVVPQSKLPSDAAARDQVHDLGDVSLLPGLVDAHCHMHCSATPDAQALIFSEDNDRFMMRATNNMRRALLAGTTTIRDIGARNEVTFPVKAAIEAGAIPGPRLICAGTPITITAGHCWMFGTEADTTEAVKTAIRRQVKLGARVIKMMATGGMFTPTANPRHTQYPVETLRAAVIEAERLNVVIVAHTLSAQGVKNCVEAGIHQLIHARWLDADPQKGVSYDHDTSKKMADKGIWVDPTIGHHLLGREARKPTNTPEPLRHWSVQARPVTDEEHFETIHKMHEAGVRYTAGLDMGMPYADHAKSAANAWAYVEELEWDTWKAIRANTADTAEALRLGAEIGRIKPGMVADLASFKGDPAARIRDLDQADTVIQGGRVVKLRGEALV